MRFTDYIIAHLLSINIHNIIRYMHKIILLS